jgi:ATP-dependent DNA ligase
VALAGTPGSAAQMRSSGSHDRYRPASFPGFALPCLATLKDEPLAGPRWVHELKLDGYRAQAMFHDGQATMNSS